MKKIIPIIFLFLFFEGFAHDKNDSLIITRLETSFNQLKHKNDSLEAKLSKIEKEDYKSIDVIEKVDNFYDKAWNKLTLFFSLAGSIILFVLPYLFAKNQEKTINLKKQEFEDHTNSKLQELEQKLQKFHQDQFNLLKDEINFASQDLNKNLKNEIETVKSMSYFLRGLVAELDGKHDLLFKNFITCAEKLISLNSNGDLKDVITAITFRLKSIDKKQIKLQKDVFVKLEKLIQNINSKYPEIFVIEIEELETLISKMNNSSS